MPAEVPYLEVETPSTIDSTLTDDGTTVVTMFTQYGPYDEAGWPEGSREAYADRCLDILAERAPNVKDAVIHREVLAPPDLERIFGLVGGSIFQGEQGLDQMAFMRPIPALAQYATPGRRPLPVRRGHAPGRRRDGASAATTRPTGSCTTSAASAPAAGCGRRCRFDACRASAGVRRRGPDPPLRKRPSARVGRCRTTTSPTSARP